MIGYKSWMASKGLAMAMILLAAIRDYFATAGDTNRADDIEREFLVTRDLRTQERIPKLNLNETDHHFFHKKVLTSSGDPARNVSPTKDSQSMSRI